MNIRKAQRTQPATEAALQKLGVGSRKARRKLGRYVDVVSMQPGGELPTAGTIIGVTGSFRCRSASGAESGTLQSPIVVGKWAPAPGCNALSSLIAEEACDLLLVDYRFDRTLFDAAPALRSLATRSASALSPNG